MKKMLIIYLLLISFPFSKAHSDGACMLEPVSLQKRTEQATLIVEGLVTNLEIVKDNNSGNIFTLYTITLSGILKGYSSENEIKILAQGGKTENEWHIVTGSLSLHPGDKGIFFCQPVNHRKNTYQSYAAAQGFIKYHEDETHAHDPFFTYKNIQEDLVQKIERIAGTPYKKIYNPEKRIGLVPDIIPSTLPVIQNLNPTTITGGTFQPLTITGSGFGSIQGSGYVEFKNCNDGGNSYIRPLSSDYISWSDTEIKVKVPSSPCAGTGDVRIVNHGGGSTQSLQILTVTYSCLNINSNGFARLPSLVNMDMKGGQTFHMNSSFEENEKAREAFLRALTSWRCATGVNFKIGQTTNNATSNMDNENVVRFAGDNELPEGVLGRCLTRLSNCLANTWYVIETDLEFSPSANWEFGPEPASNGKIDFETVVLHEIGHAHLLNHIIKPDAIMHFALARGQNKRTLNNDNDIIAGRFLLDKSAEPKLCGPSSMVRIQQETCANPEGPFETIKNTSENTTSINIFYDYTTDELNIIIKQMNLGNDAYLLISDIHGRQVKNISVKTINGNHSSSHLFQHLPKGVYIFALYTKDGRHSGKFVK